MIDETIFAVSTNESRPVYMGSMFEIDAGVLTLVSVDGYRLALRRESIEGCAADGMRFIIPGTALSEVERICGDTDDPALINVGAKHVSFTIGETVVVSRRLEGDFLNYKKAVPENFRSKIKVERGEFLSIVDRVSLVVDDKIKSPIRLTFGDGSVEFHCVTPLGKAEDICPCEGAGGDVEIGFNDRYLRDALRAAPSDELLVCINTGSSPCVLVPADESGKFVYMVLPVRLRAGE
jgi:DNA polymerase-3 subunit beta